MIAQLVLAVVVEALEGRLLDRASTLASQILTKRNGREWMVLRFRGGSANWMPPPL